MGGSGDIHTEGRVEGCSFALELRLLGGFQLRANGHVVDAMHCCERVLAFLALNDRSLPRAYVAASLWPDTTDRKAGANLRSALWRIHRCGHDVIDAAGSNLALRADVWVDVRYVEASARAHRASGVVPEREFIDRVRGELLPGFWDSWLVFERERLRHETTNLFEAMCGDALAHQDHHVAVLAALAAVECDPLRESSTGLLVRAHLSAGNRTAALITLRRHIALLRDELGESPSRELIELTDLGKRSVRAPRAAHAQQQQ